MGITNIIGEMETINILSDLEMVECRQKIMLKLAVQGGQCQIGI